MASVGILLSHAPAAAKRREAGVGLGPAALAPLRSLWPPLLDDKPGVVVVADPHLAGRQPRPQLPRATCIGAVTFEAGVWSGGVAARDLPSADRTQGPHTARLPKPPLAAPP